MRPSDLKKGVLYNIGDSIVLILSITERYNPHNQEIKRYRIEFLNLTLNKKVIRFYSAFDYTMFETFDAKKGLARSKTSVIL